MLLAERIFTSNIVYPENRTKSLAMSKTLKMRVKVRREAVAGRRVCGYCRLSSERCCSEP